MENLLRDLEFVIIPGRPRANAEVVNLHNKAYKYWRTEWSKVFTEAGCPDAVNPDDFFRQDLVSMILKQGEIVAFHTATIFDLSLDVIKDLRYFSIFKPETFQFLKNEKKQKLMSYEFLSVHPEWRKGLLGQSLGRVICDLGTKYMYHAGMDATIAPARLKTKVDQITYELGAVKIQENVVRGGLECDLIAIFADRYQPLKDKETSDMVARLWANRKDYTGLPIQERRIQRVA